MIYLPKKAGSGSNNLDPVSSSTGTGRLEVRHGEISSKMSQSKDYSSPESIANRMPTTTVLDNSFVLMHEYFFIHDFIGDYSIARIGNQIVKKRRHVRLNLLL
jgi:hypothetical protein